MIHIFYALLYAFNKLNVSLKSKHLLDPTKLAVFPAWES